MANYTTLPAPSPEQGLNRYLQEIRQFPMLEPEEEYMLAKRWVEENDTEAAHKMVTSHLRLAAKIAMGYRGYGLPQAEVVSEANVGLMQAVKRFDPEKGFRLSTYAMWWIRAAIQEYILRSWSLVKLGTTSAQKKLFFNLRKAKNRIGALEEGDLRPENVARIANDLGVTEDEVTSMNRRMAGGDASLNVMVGQDGDSSTPVAGLARGRGRRPGRRHRRARRARDAPRDAGRIDGRAQRARGRHPDAPPPGRRARDAGGPFQGLLGQPRAHPPDRGAGLREALGPHARARRRKGHARGPRTPDPGPVPSGGPAATSHGTPPPRAGYPPLVG